MATAPVLTRSEQRINILTQSNVARIAGRIEESDRLWHQYLQLCEEDGIHHELESCSVCYYIGNIKEFVLHPITKKRLCIDCKYLA